MSVEFPDVPDAPGVPPVLRDGLPPAPVDSALTADGPDISSNVQGARWGVYLNGALVLEPDSVVSFEFSHQFRVSNFPIEGGKFAAYNKVATPFDTRVQFAKGGNDEDRASFLAALDTTIRALDLYDVITPERTYTGVNLTRYDFKRTSSQGITLLLVDLQLEEIRVSAAATFTNSKSPAGADAVNDGAVQPTTPTPAQGGE